MSGNAAYTPQTPEESTLRYALRHIVHWPIDVNKDAERDLVEIKNFAQRTLEDVGDVI